MSKSSYNIDKEWLECEYSKGRSAADLARKVGCCETNLKYWIKKYNIKCRPSKLENCLSRGELVNLYYNQGLTYKKIAQKYGFSFTAVRNLILKWNIPQRKYNEELNLDSDKLLKLYHELKNTNKVAEVLNCSGRSVVNYLERIGQPRIYALKGRKIGIPSPKRLLLDDDEVIKLYKETGSINQVAKKFECSNATIVSLLERNGIQRNVKTVWTPEYIKNVSERLRRRQANGEFSGENHPNWQGGKTSFHFYLRNSQATIKWRNAIFKRDNYICGSCGQRGGKLQAHHFKPFSIILSEFLDCYKNLSPIQDRFQLIELAKNYQPFWNLENGIIVCLTCHQKKRSATAKIQKEYRCAI